MIQKGDFWGKNRRFLLFSLLDNFEIQIFGFFVKFKIGRVLLVMHIATFLVGLCAEMGLLW
jgi:hypothetical protein